MSEPWTAVLVLGAATLALKCAGPLALGGRTVDPSVERALAALVPAALVALVVVGTFADGRGLALDARVPGTAAAGIAILARAPVTLVVVLAAATTALARQVAV